MSDARGHKHRPANGRKAGGVPHGEAKAWLVRQGRGGRKEANPRTTSVWNPLLLFDLASTTSSTLGKSGPSALSRLRPRRPQGLFFDFGLEGPHAKRDRSRKDSRFAWGPSAILKKRATPSTISCGSAKTKPLCHTPARWAKILGMKEETAEQK